jgi:hypothetical protein
MGVDITTGTSVGYDAAGVFVFFTVAAESPWAWIVLTTTRAQKTVNPVKEIRKRGLFIKS